MAPSSPASTTHHRSSSSSTNKQQTNKQVRKYLVVLHDCLAIKFHPSLTSGPGTTSTCQNHNHNVNSEPSVQGFTLFKGFRDANINGIWNMEAFQHLEYRGFVLPNTIFISSLPKFTQIIRNAWTRQMIRNPPGFTIHFMGEIEDIICDPIPQNQWTPLSDSLCWTIQEMTSRGEEAFVETIRASLAQATRLMVQPSRELVYQTLERLTMEQKIYQTSRGYFIVTPGQSCCWRDCVVTHDGSGRGHKVAHMTTPSAGSCSTPAAFSSHSLMTLDALLTPPHHHQQNHQEDRLSCSRHSWDSAVSTERPKQLNEKETQKLKRHNSLKFFRSKDSQVKGSLGARSLSLRLSRSRSIPYAGKCDSSEQSRGYESQLGVQLEDEKENQSDDKIKIKKGKSLLSKLFSWTKSSSNKKKRKSTIPSSESSALSTSMQTPLGSSGSGLGLNSDYFLDTSKNQLDTCDIESGCFTLDSSHHHRNHHHQRDHHHYTELGLTSNLANLRWNSLPKRNYRSSSSRRSILTLAAEEDVGSLYAAPAHHHKTVSGSELSSLPICPSQTVPSPFHQRPPSGRSSTSFSQGTSLGYGSGSQGPHNESHSPCPSLSTTTTTNGPYATVNNNYNSNGSSKSYQRRYSGSNSVYSPVLRSDASPAPINGNHNYSRPLYETIGDRKSITSSVSPVKENTTAATNINNNNKETTEPTLTNQSNQKNKLELGFGGGTTTTTTLTQNVTSRTNLELEFLVPLGGKLRVGQEEGGNRNNQDMSVSIDMGSKGDNNNREVKTIVNQNGIIETHFDCGQVKSTIEIKTRGDDGKKSNNE